MSFEKASSVSDGRLNELKRLRRAGDVPALIRALTATGSGGGLVRARAAQYVGELEAVEAVDALIELCGDAVEEVRVKAVIALGRIGDARALEPLMQLVDDPNRWVRAHALAGLGSIGEPVAIPALVSRLGAKSWIWDRAPAIYGLLLMDDEQAEAIAREELKAAGWFRRRAVVRDVRKARRRRGASQARGPRNS